MWMEEDPKKRGSTVRAGDLPQRLDVARVLRPVDGGGPLVIGFQLGGLVGKAVGTTQQRFVWLNCAWFLATLTKLL